MQRLFKFHIVNAIHPSKRDTLKSYSISYLKLEAIYCNHQISHCHFHIKVTVLWLSSLLLASSECNSSDTDSLFSRNENMKGTYFTSFLSSLIFWLFSLSYFFILALKTSFKFLCFQGNLTSKKNWVSEAQNHPPPPSPPQCFVALKKKQWAKISLFQSLWIFQEKDLRWSDCHELLWM